MKEWLASGDQWSQTWYRFADGKLFVVERDNKEQQETERQIDVGAFLREHAGVATPPFAEIVAFLEERGAG